MTEIVDRLVVDASVLGAVFFLEPEAAFLEKRLGGKVWVAPTLIDYEVGSIFLKKMKTHAKMRKELHDCYRLYCDARIERVEVPIHAVIPLAEKYGLTVYDASYFWLAKELDLDLLTLDKQLSLVWAKK